MNIVWTDSARDDLIDIRRQLQQAGSPADAARRTREIRDEVAALKQWPNRGTYVEEIEEFNLTKYRQLVAGPHRVIFERGPEAFYIHLVCPAGGDLGRLLRRRLITF